MYFNWVTLKEELRLDADFPVLEKKEKQVLWQSEKSFHYFAVDFDEKTNFSIEIEGFSNCVYQLYQVKPTSAHIGRGSQWGVIPDYPITSYYDILVPYDQTSLATKQQLFCLEIESADPGLKSGRIQLLIEGVLQGELPLSLEILPQRFLESESFGLELWQYPFAVARYYGISEENYFGSEHLSKIKESLVRYHQAGGDVIVTAIIHDPWNHQTYDDYPSLIKWQKTAAGFTYDFTWFDQYVELNLEVGISKKIKCFSMLPWEDKIYFWNEKNELEQVQYLVGSKEWQMIWGEFLNAFVAHIEAKGWFDKTYIAIDERPAETLAHVIDLLERYPNQLGERLKLSCAMDYQNFDETLLDQIADVSIGQSHLGSRIAFNTLCESRRQKGLFTSIYNCVGDYPSMFLYSSPYETQWVLWNAVSYGSDGFLRWALDAWVENPLENASHWYWESGDSFLIYPHEKGGSGAYLSIRYQQLIEGMIQIRKYNQLKKQSPSSLVELEELLATLIFPQGTENAYGARVALESTSHKEIQQVIEKINRLLNQSTLAVLQEEK